VATTNGGGDFVITPVLAGNYTLTVAADTFDRAVTKRIEVQVAQIVGFSGTATGDAYANFLLGLPNTGSRAFLQLTSVDNSGTSSFMYRMMFASGE
jgi:hypothetical protein